MSNLSNNEIKIFNSRFPTGMNCEGLWRRHQSSKNKLNSGWINNNSRRKKIIYHKDNYLINNEDLVIEKTYLYYIISAPILEIQQHIRYLHFSAEYGRWITETHNKYKKRIGDKDLIFEYSLYERHPFDESDYENDSEDYRTLEIIIYSEDTDCKTLEKRSKKAWNVFTTGMRKKEPTGKHSVKKNIDWIEEFLPAQLEIGCGPSIELGIPPLNYQHEAYKLQDSLGNFMFAPNKTGLIESFLLNSVAFFEKISAIPKYSAIADIKDSHFYKSLKTFYKKSVFVGPLINHNFDGVLNNEPSISQKNVRIFEEVYPDIKLHSDAKSLIVVGLHADRRYVRKIARKSGLKIIIVDPEQGVSYNKIIKYPLEPLQKGDIHIPISASEFSRLLLAKITGKPANT